MGVFFASAGRMGRLAFMPAIAVVIGLFAAYERWVTGGLHLATGWLAHLILLFMGASVLASRLHDRGRSGWWAAVVILAFGLAWASPQGPLGWLCEAVLVLAAVDLGLMPGQKGFNAFGPPPR